MAQITTDFERIYYNQNPVHGKLRLANNGLGWKQAGETSEKPVTLGRDDVRYASWTRVARNFQLRLETKQRNIMIFENFKRDDHDRLRNLLKNNYEVNLEDREISVRGWNWGKADVEGSDLQFLVAGIPAFAMPLSQLHNTSINKQEVAIEFLPPSLTESSDKKKKRGEIADELMEMRLYIPGSEANAKARAKRAAKVAKKEAEASGNGDVEMKDAKPKKESQSDDEEQDEDDEEDGDSDPDPEGAQAAQVFHDTLKERSELGQEKGVSFASFSEVHCMTPRGKYDIDMFGDFMRLRNKSYDYKLLYSSIRRLFIMPKTDDINMLFVVNVDPPIRQGQTRYPYLVMQFASDEVMDAQIDLSDDEIKAKFPTLKEKYEDAAYTVVSQVVKAVSGQKTVAPAKDYESKSSHQAVKCNYRTSEGHVYFLEKAIFFISKQPMYVSYNDIQKAHFERVSSAMASARTFDLRLELKADSDITFSAIIKEEHENISEFFTTKDITYSDEFLEDMVSTNQAVAAALAADQSSDDGDSDDSDNSAAADRKKSQKDRKAMDLDDEDSEVDEDFKADQSASDVAEEFDEAYSSAGSSDGEKAKPKKKKKKAADDEGDSPPRKKKQKRNESSD